MSVKNSNDTIEDRTRDFHATILNINSNSEFERTTRR